MTEESNRPQYLLPDYIVEKTLGVGGMGQVLLVRSQSTGQRYAAKKTLLKNERERNEFLRELHAWMELPVHPNIAPCDSYELIILSQYAEGGTLADWIALHKLTNPAQILDVAIQIAWGLNAMHERGLIHQDVKPANILMSLDGRPMITDFGLTRARSLHSEENNATLVESSIPRVLVSSRGMTPAYASPEQREGKILTLKADMWSWGVSVLDIFMGGVSCPHGGHIAPNVLDAFLENGGQEEGLPRMPNEVAEILRTCFANDPRARWATMEQVATALIYTYEQTQGQSFKQLRPPVNTMEQANPC